MKKYAHIIFTISLVVTASTLTAQADFASQYKIQMEKIKKEIKTKLAEMKVFASVLNEYPSSESEITKNLTNESIVFCNWPVNGELTSGYGYRRDPFTRKRAFHNGVDLSVPSGTPVYAAAKGKVKKVGRNKRSGKYIIISHGDKYESIYCHLSNINVMKGDKVTPETKIGSSGNTGRSTGPHLHFEIRENGKSVNPFSIIH